MRRNDDLNHQVTERALAASVPAELGAWVRTVRVHRRDDALATTNAGVVFAMPWSFLGAGFVVEMAWYYRVLIILCALLVLAVGTVLLVDAVRRVFAGGALVHLFDLGLVLERVRGEVVALPYAGTEFDFVTWTESTNDSQQTKVQLWITLPDGPTVSLDGRTEAEIRVLEVIAVHCELPPRPRDAERRHYRKW